jgi:hypothetical protein
MRRRAASIPIQKALHRQKAERSKKNEINREPQLTAGLGSIELDHLLFVKIVSTIYIHVGTHLSFAIASDVRAQRLGWRTLLLCCLTQRIRPWVAFGWLESQCDRRAYATASVPRNPSRISLDSIRATVDFGVALAT